MTWLDIVVVAVLGLAGLGGYAQGLIRGLVRLAGLLGVMILGLVAVVRFADRATPQATLIWTAACIALSATIMGAGVWVVTHSIPGFIHRQISNRMLGIIPALVEAFLIVVLALALAERLAPQSATQQMIRSGSVTGPLLLPVDRLESALVLR